MAGNKYLNTIMTLVIINDANGFWDVGTTTKSPAREDTLSRLSFFRWQRVEFQTAFNMFYSTWVDWTDQSHRRQLGCVAGVSIDLIPLSTAVLMSRRLLITSANYLDPYMNRQRDVRVWALGRAGAYHTPYRYRIWRVWRVFPRSVNPEHQHGAMGRHSPRHDVSLLITLDQIYLFDPPIWRFMYAFRARLTRPHWTLSEELLYAGSGFEYMEHVLQNYKIFYGLAYKSWIVDCSKYLPKWWGKFICITNKMRAVGVQNGGSLFSSGYLVGVGCFEIRINQDRILVFTDLRYYVNILLKFGDISAGDYYEYAYPEWGIQTGAIYDGNHNNPYIPHWQIKGNTGINLGKKK